MGNQSKSMQLTNRQLPNREIPGDIPEKQTTEIGLGYVDKKALKKGYIDHGPLNAEEMPGFSGIWQL